MATTRDSIQTLLKQRRELRDYLNELRDEISNLKDKADQFTEAAQPQRPALSESEIVSLPEVPIPSAPSLDELVTLPSFGEETQSVQEPAIVEDTRLEEHHIQKRVLDLETTVSQMISSSDESLPETEIKQEVKEQKQPLFDATTEQKELRRHAVLVARFLLHHPTPVSDAEADELNRAIEATKTGTAPQQAPAEAYAKLDDVYRTIIAVLYPAMGVNGATIEQSDKGSILLGVISFAAVLLMLFILPLMTYADVFLGEELSEYLTEHELLYVSLLVLFMWAGCGALTMQSFRIAGALHKKIYEKSHFKDSWALVGSGGVLGLVSLPLIELFSFESEFEKAVLMAVVSYVIGFVFVAGYSHLSSNLSTVR